jgi:hypothetical protein
MEDVERDSGGRPMPGKKWVVSHFLVEVAAEYPKDTSMEEALEDAAEFMVTRSRTKGRVHDSFCSITNVRELPEGRALGKLLDKARRKATKAVKA